MSKFYIAIDVYGWNQNNDLEKAIQGRDEDSGQKCTLNVFEVEGDPKMTYRINWFIPQIDGAVWVYSRELDRNSDEQKFNYTFPNDILEIPKKKTP